MKHFQRDQMKIDDVTHAIKDLHFIDVIEEGESGESGDDPYNVFRKNTNRE